MAHTSHNQANKILNAAVKGAGYTRVTTGILKLYINDDHPAKDGTGGTLLAGFSGKSFSWNGTQWTVTGMTFTNAQAITGDANLSATQTATGYALFEPDGVTLMFSGPLTAPIEILSGTPPTVPVGAIDGTISGDITDVFGNDVIDHIVTGAGIVWPATDIEVDIVSTAPTASAAGTRVVWVGYAPLAIAVGTPWTVTNNVAELTPGTTPSFAPIGAITTSPRGYNLYKDDANTAANRMFFKDRGSTRTINVGDQLVYVGGEPTQTIKITLD